MSEIDHQLEKLKHVELATAGYIAELQQHHDPDNLPDVEPWVEKVPVALRQELRGALNVAKFARQAFLRDPN